MGTSGWSRPSARSTVPPATASGYLVPGALQRFDGLGLRREDALGVQGQGRARVGELHAPPHAPQQSHAGGLPQGGDLLRHPVRKHRLLMDVNGRLAAR
jgi:hypothetical protein